MSVIKQPYEVILADPPWNQKRGGKKAERPNSSGGLLVYPTLSLPEITDHLEKAKLLAAPKHVLFLWTIDKYLFEAEDIAKHLGYKLHARMIWNKVTGIPAAFTVRYGHEYLLYCTYGGLLPVAAEARGKIHTVFTEQVRSHSEKPEESYRISSQLYPNQLKLEMYARKNREGWDAFGNQVPNSIELP